MRIPPALLLSVFVSFAHADDLPKFDKLKLKTGREYEKVTVTEKRPDGISIAHDSGTARIKFEDLPNDVAKKLGGFNAEAATKARDETDAKELAMRSEIERGMSATPEAGQSPAEEEKPKAKVIQKYSFVTRIMSINGGQREVAVS